MEEEGRLPSEVVGMRGVSAFADLLSRYPVEVSQMKDECITRWCDENDFNKEQHVAFKEGVGTVLSFFLACQGEVKDIEYQKMIAKAEKESSLKK